MTSQQISMFQAGAGVTPATLMMAIASMVVVLTFVWVVWVTVGTFRAWQDGDVSVFELTWSALRACIVLMVLGFYLR
jgi:integrating conjugative element protein (TIGR03758 family)